MFKKSKLWQVTIVFCSLSFGLGYILKSLEYKHEQNGIKSLKTENNIKSEQIDKTAQKISTKIEVKTYYKTGQLKSTQQKTIVTQKIGKISTAIKIDEKSNQKFDTKAKFRFGVLYPAFSKNFDVQNLTPTVSYNVLANFWLTAQSTVMFKDVKIGIEIEL